jgi:class 3 adenylate cyclase/tetratricopeptide (TPR) repeat protein
MQCPRCQATNRDGRRFCGECGAALAVVCSACGFSNDGGEKYCGGCGSPLAAPRVPTAAAPAAEPKLPSPESYTPQHLAERILTSRGALEGERKQVTVLFADLKGSMELLADRDPEEARAILDPVLERLMDAVHRYEGTVNQVMGDGIMALFGAPLAYEDHAVRACYAALRMQESVRQYAAELRRTQGLPLQIRVGLNSGEVVVRSIGSDLRMDYTAVGQTTHLAARMEQLAMPGSVLLASDTLRLAEGYVQVTALGPMPVKGIGEPVEVYELTGAGQARSRMQVASARGLTKFVGRETELDVLRQTLERAGQGQGQVVALVGEPGMGKSRLTWEFTHSHRAQGWLALEASSVSYGKAHSWLPVSDLLRTYFQIEVHDDHRRIRQKVLGRVLDLDEALRPTLPALYALLDVPVEDAQWEQLDPLQRRQRTLEAMKRLLLRESQAQPLLLVFEDLHWIDGETQALLDSLVESLPTARALLLVNYRPEYEHGWHRKGYYRGLRLDPLAPASAEELLGALVGRSGELEPVRRMLAQKTQGNPFFLEESVRTLAETGALVGERGAYRVAKPLAAIQVPATVQAVLAARIDRLGPEDKRLLQAAAVNGKDVPYPLLREVADLAEDALRQGLARLQAAEFLYEAALFPELEYTFKHALTHEVAYGSLLQERRRVLHARIVGAMEGLYADRLAEQIERLAHHALRGEVWESAVAYLRQAGAKAAARSAHREAVVYFEEALEALRHLPEGQETLEQAVDIRLDLRNSLFPISEFARCADHLRQAEAIATALGDSRRLALAAAYMSQYYWQQGDHLRAVESSERALASATAGGDFAIQVEANFRMGMAYSWLGNLPGALDYLGANVASLEGDLSRERFGLPYLPYANSGLWMGRCHAERGEFAAGRARAEQVLPVATEAGDPWSLGMVHWSLGQLHLYQGELQAAIPLLERAHGIIEAGSLPYLLPWAGTFLGYAYALAGRTTEAVALLEQALEQAMTTGFMGTVPLQLAQLSEAYLLAGRVDDARAAATRALDLAREHRARTSEAWALRLHGEIAAYSTPPDAEQAEACYREALALADELGMRPLAAHCHLGLGTLYRQVGRSEDARSELATAIDMYRAMEMTFWLQRAEAALGAAPAEA